jgi:hypothetical protein
MNHKMVKTSTLIDLIWVIIPKLQRHSGQVALPKATKPLRHN